ncbi:MAG: hypothetical protein U0T11_01565 [Chitinophagaceae bacterium]
MSFSSKAQNIQTVIKTEALKMARALSAMDFQAYSQFVYPTLLSDPHNKELIRKGIDSVEKYRKEFGVKVKSVVIGNPSAVVTYKNVMQCTIPQTTTIEAFMGSITTENTLIALSKDGKTWYFVDALVYKQKESKSKLPELSPQLVIPDMKQPVIRTNESGKN